MKVVVNLLLVLFFCTFISACNSSSSGGMPSIPSSSSETETSSSAEKNSAEESSEQNQASNDSESSQSSAEEQLENAASGNESDSSQEEAQTDEEKVAMLDAQLEEELRSYGEQLHKELEKAEEQKQAQARERDAKETAEAGVDEEEVSAEEDDEGEENQQNGSEQEQMAKADSQQNSQGSETKAENNSSEGDNGQGNKGRTPANIPSGNDDDVVAKQLREAAEKEQDPELREKLWEEYRKYKKQQSTASAQPSTVTKSTVAYIKTITMNKNISSQLFILLVALIFTGCSTTAVKIDNTEEIELETTQLQESKLLDVGVLLFEKGELTEKQKEKQGVHEDIRQAEARYMAYHLKETMQHSNGWGAIRVLPEKILYCRYCSCRHYLGFKRRRVDDQNKCGG